MSGEEMKAKQTSSLNAHYGRWLTSGCYDVSRQISKYK